MRETARKFVFVLGGLLVVGLFSLSCGVVSAPEKHLIPEDYRGGVFIVPNMPFGALPQREGLSIVFEIPDNGILVTQDSFSSHWHTRFFYLVDPQGGRQRIYQKWGSEEPERDTPFIGKQISATSKGVDLPCTVRYVRYEVSGPGEPKSVDSYNSEELRFNEYVREHNICP